MRILYVTGWGRSGSTIVGNILNEADGFFHTGELNYIWENGLIRNDSCGCGQPVKSCELWHAVFEKMGSVEPGHMGRLRDRAPKNKAVLKELLGFRKVRWSEHRAYTQTLGKLYRAIAEVAECDVILDSSKAPSYGYLLGQLPGFKVYYLHLVRDARATAFSWQRKVQRTDAQGGKYMEQHTLLENAKRWMLCNAISELIGRKCPTRYIRLRYEDFVQTPAKATRTVSQFATEEVRELPFETSHRVRLGTNHTIWGNPKRATRGSVRIRQDDVWRSEMHKADSLATTLLTWPLLLKYGYSLA